MFQKFQEEKIFTVLFNDRYRSPLFIHKVTALKTDKKFKFTYIAKDNQLHNHTYYKNAIKYYEITKEQEDEFRQGLKELKQHERGNGTFPAVSYRGSRIHQFYY